MWQWLVVVVMTCGACGGPERPPEHLHLEGPTESPPPSQPCAEQLPLGDPSQLTLRTVPGFEIAAPQTCSGESYIRIERTHGRRKLGVAVLGGRGFAEGCMDPAKFAACDTINVGALVTEVSAELEREGIATAGNGEGPCAANLDGGYSGWNYSVGVHDWKDSDRLVAKITELMDRYDVEGYVGARVWKTRCAHFD